VTGENVEERGELRSKIFKLKVFRKDRSSKGKLENRYVRLSDRFDSSL